MVTETAYGLSRRLSLPYEEALPRVKDALKDEGFGVLTEIDVKETLRQKLQADFRRYDIIGACNVVVYEEDDGGTTVAAFDPEAAMGLAANPALEAVAREAKARLKRAIEHV